MLRRKEGRKEGPRTKKRDKKEEARKDGRKAGRTDGRKEGRKEERKEGGASGDAPLCRHRVRTLNLVGILFPSFSLLPSVRPSPLPRFPTGLDTRVQF